MNPMLPTFTLALIFFCCPGPGRTTKAEDTTVLSMDSKLTNIMDMMVRMDAEMKAKDQRIEAMEADMKTKENVVKSLKEDMKTFVDNCDKKISMLEDSVMTNNQKVEDKLKSKNKRISFLEAEIKSLRGRMTETEETDLQLREVVDQVRNPLFAFQCAWQDGWNTDNAIITYDRLTYDDMSGGSIYNVTGGMDISTGVYKVGHGFSGVWTVSWSFKSFQKNGNTKSTVFLYLNGQEIEESHHGTYNSNSGEVATMGGKTLHLRLEEGDEVTLRTVTIYRLEFVTICFELAQFDWRP